MKGRPICVLLTWSQRGKKRAQVKRAVLEAAGPANRVQSRLLAPRMPARRCCTSRQQRRGAEGSIKCRDPASASSRWPCPSKKRSRDPASISQRMCGRARRGDIAATRARRPRGPRVEQDVAGRHRALPRPSARTVRERHGPSSAMICNVPLSRGTALKSGVRPGGRRAEQWRRRPRRSDRRRRFLRRKGPTARRPPVVASAMGVVRFLLADHFGRSTASSTPNAADRPATPVSGWPETDRHAILRPSACASCRRA